MASVLPQSAPAFGFNLPSSAMDPTVEVNEPVFVETLDHPQADSSLREHNDLAADPFPWTASAHPGLEAVQAPTSGSSTQHNGHKSVALPQFNFNPGATMESAQQTSSPPDSPTASISQPIPSKIGHRHRRTRSELPGVDPRAGSVSASLTSPDKPNARDSQEPKTLAPSLYPGKGHKHRRSAAVSKDLTSVVSQQGSLNSRDGHEDGLSVPSSTIGSSHTRTDSHHTSKSSSPVRASFADNLGVPPRHVFPTLRPSSTSPAVRPTHSSDGIPSRQDRPFLPNRPATVGAPTGDTSISSYFETPVDEPFSDFPSVSIVEHADHELLPFAWDDADILDDNFGEEPTFGVEIAQHTSALEPPRSSSPRIDIHSAPESDSVIDLDTANDLEEAAPLTAEGLRNLRLKSFSAARRNMHSGGTDNTSTRSAFTPHRRTESAPSLAAPFFSERPKVPRTETADTASEKGFEMSNVFEEDEEDLETAREDEEQFRLDSRRKSEQFGLGLGIGPTGEHSLGDGYTKRSSVVLSEGSDSTPTNERDIPSRAQTIRQVASNRQSLVLSEPNAEEKSVEDLSHPPTDRMPMPISTFDSFNLSSRPLYEHQGSVGVAPWLQQQDPSSYGSTPNDASQSSAWSTPKLDTAATSVSDNPRLSLPRFQGDASSVCTDGIPSLISSASTTSGLPLYADSVNTPSTPGGTQSRNSRLSLKSQTERRRKRSSIASLSQLMSMSRSSGLKSSMAVEETERCQTSGGLSTVDSSGAPTPVKEKKMKRLGRALKFWKSKEEVPQE